LPTKWQKKYLTTKYKMNSLKENANRSLWKPIRVPSNSNFKKIIKQILKNPGVQVIDQYDKNLEELFLLRNPKYRFNPDYFSEFKRFREKHIGKGAPEIMGVWFYFPWSNNLVHFLPEKMHQELRTGRNQYLITKQEQERYYESVIGVLGMSVGSHVALTIAMTGGARHIKLADPDNISGDNLNRVRTGFQNVGTNKSIAVARQIFEINPYAKVEIYKNGLTEANAKKFLKDIDVLVEEMDDPYLKINVRFLAKKMGMPVIMAADNGDGIIADVERFDRDKTYPILHGLIGEKKSEDLKKILPENLPGIMAKIAGADIANLRMLESVAEVGKSIYSWPQLGTAATMCGAVLAYLARRIILRDSKIRSGRYEVNPDAIFESGYNLKFAKSVREKQRNKLLKKII